MKEQVIMNRTQFRAAVRKRRKADLKKIQAAFHIPKALVQHARRHGGDAETIRLEYLKHKGAGFVDLEKLRARKVARV